MIFATVGTGSRGFDALVREMDLLAEGMTEEVIVQIGNGTYVPVHSSYFRFATPLQPYFERARVVVSAGGTGTIFDLLAQAIPVIAVCNTEIPDGHQNELLRRLSTEGYVTWCRDLTSLREAVSACLISSKRYVKPDCRIEEVIREKLWGRVDN